MMEIRNLPRIHIAREMLGGIQVIFKFDNGYGASVINHAGSYETELGVIKFYGDEWSLCYDTPITDDVIGYIQTREELIVLLNRIEAL
jgi:predicted dehydrogenase